MYIDLWIIHPRGQSGCNGKRPLQDVHSIQTALINCLFQIAGTGTMFNPETVRLMMSKAYIYVDNFI